jgi:hypothetical protein
VNIQGETASYYMGVFNIGNLNSSKTLTFVLDSNITLEGTGNAQGKNYNNFISVYANATFVLRPGALATKYRATTKIDGRTPIVVYAGGRVRLEGGSITDCIFNNVASGEGALAVTAGGLISFRSKEEECAPGSFYKAASVVLSNNVNLNKQDANEVVFFTGSVKSRQVYPLTDEEMSLPAEAAE